MFSSFSFGAESCSSCSFPHDERVKQEEPFVASPSGIVSRHDLCKLERRMDRMEKTGIIVLFVLLALGGSRVFVLLQDDDSGLSIFQITLCPHYDYHAQEQPFKGDTFFEFDKETKSTVTARRGRTMATAQLSRLQSRRHLPIVKNISRLNEPDRKGGESSSALDFVGDQTIVNQPSDGRREDVLLDKSSSNSFFHNMTERGEEYYEYEGRSKSRGYIGNTGKTMKQTERKTSGTRGLQRERRKRKSERVTSPHESHAYSSDFHNRTLFAHISPNNATNTANWDEVEQSASKCINDGVWNAELFSPISRYTNYRLDRRIFELTQVATSLSGAHYLWTTLARRQALCWLLYHDRRQLLSEDTFLIEHYTVAVLYYVTTAKNTNWLRDRICNANECDGLKHDESGHVVGIDVTDEHVLLSGTLPHEMFTGFEYLQMVDVVNQKISGTIPSEIGSSTNLIRINLASNDLTGTIPTEIGQLPALEQLHLNNNNLEGTISPSLFVRDTNLKDVSLHNNQLDGTIPYDIGNAVKLRWLVLNTNNLQGTIPFSLFTSCTQLEYLRLNDNSLTGTIPDEIKNLKGLMQLRLYDNMLRGPLPSGIGHLPLLNTLYLNLKEYGGSIPTDIVNATNLSQMDLSGSQLTGKIPKEIGKLTKLKALDMSNNLFGGEIPSSFWDISFHVHGMYNSYRPQFSLINNTNLYGKVPTKFCDKVGGGSLRLDTSTWMRKPRVNCSCCDTCDEGGIQDNCDGTYRTKMCPLDRYTGRIEFSCYNNFEIIDVENNRSIYTITYPPAFLNPSTTFWSHLNRVVPVMGCYRAIFHTNEDIKFELKYHDHILAEEHGRPSPINETYVPIDFGFVMDSSGVPILDAGRCDSAPNICDGIAFDTGTPERRMLNHLSHYGLMTEDISILFDSDTSESKALCFVVRNALSANFTRDELEERICTGKLVQIYVLSILLFNNKAWLVEELFRNGSSKSSSTLLQYCQWPGITCKPYDSIVTGIDLSDKNLSGTLPSEISLLNGLEFLVLQNNDLSGTIPDTIPFYPLKRLRLGHNHLSGTLHEAFSVPLPQLEELDLSHNLLAGTLTIFSAKEWDLKHLDLSDNYFTGEFPSGLFESIPKNLTHLDLSRNGLIGTVSPQHVVHPSLEVLSLHGNSFSGPIQNWIFTDLPKLKTLWLHSNRFTGTIPTEVGLAEDLSSLTLSHNELQGTIPKQLEQLDKKQQLTKLLLQGNELSGSHAPNMEYLRSLGGDAFVTDCGHPFFLLPSKLDCTSCTVCCNSEGRCQSNTPYQMSITTQTAIFLASILAVLAFFCVAVVILQRLFVAVRKNNATTHGNQVQEEHHRRAQELCGVRSIYSFLLSPNYVGWIIYLVTYALQIMTFIIFLNPADFHHESSDWQYSKRCPANSFDCEDESNVTNFGWFIFASVLSSKLAVDIVNGFLLLYKACSIQDTTTPDQPKVFCCSTSSTNGNIVRFIVSGIALILITSLAAWTSIVYNRATAMADTELVYNAVVLLFVNDLDELIYALVATVAPHWLATRVKEMEQLESTTSSHTNSNICVPDVDNDDEAMTLPKMNDNTFTNDEDCAEVTENFEQ